MIFSSEDLSDFLDGEKDFWPFEWSWRDLLFSFTWLEALCFVLGSLLELVTLVVGLLGVFDWPFRTVIALLALACLYRFFWSLYRQHIGLKIGPFTCLFHTMLFIVPVWLSNEVVGRCFAGLNWFWKYFVLWGVIAMISIFLIKIIIRLTLPIENAIYQKLRDRRAKNLARAVISSDGNGAPRFSLYLRPFYITSKLPAVIGSSLLSFELEGEALPVDLETVLETAIEPFAPLVGLGRPQEAAGAGRIETENTDWQNAIRHLIEKATLIFVLPSERSGTLWELSFLKEKDLLARCIFIMPGGTDLPFIRRWHVYQVEDWERACLAVKPLGIELPPYLHRGSLFTLDSGGQLRELYRITLLSNPMAVPHLREVIARVSGLSAGLAT